MEESKRPWQVLYSVEESKRPLQEEYISVMVDRAAFDEIIQKNFVEKKKNSTTLS